jgi:hypothetical protein
LSRCRQEEPVICYVGFKTVVSSYFARFFDGHGYRGKNCSLSEREGKERLGVSICWMQKVALQESVSRTCWYSREQFLGAKAVKEADIEG